jgi:hypothetical protein
MIVVMAKNVKKVAASTARSVYVRPSLSLFAVSMAERIPMLVKRAVPTWFWITRVNAVAAIPFDAKLNAQLGMLSTIEAAKPVDV